MTEVSSLSTSQEEADTRMFLHALYAMNHLQGNIFINSPDTDVFIISLMVSEKNNANINFKSSNKNKARTISVNKVKESLKDKYDAVVSIGLEYFTKTLVSLHAFTGCDTVSAFVGLGKSKAFKIMAKNIDYIKLFEKLCHQAFINYNFSYTRFRVRKTVLGARPCTWEIVSEKE